MPAARLSFSTHSTQIQGNRTTQEDSYDVGVLYTGKQGELVALSCRQNPPPEEYECIYAIVADGMGGHDDGEMASSAVVDYFPKALAREGNLRDAAVLANERLALLKEQGKIAPNAGCTLVACMLRANKWLSTVSIGDSLICMQRDGNLSQINEIHTRGAQLDAMVLAGEITAEEASKETKRAALTCAVMGRPLTQCDYKGEEFYATKYGELKADDRVLIMSDGVLTLGLDHIEELCAGTEGKPPFALVNGLMRDIEQIAHPKQDNTTVVCLQAMSPDRASTPGWVFPRRAKLMAAGTAALALLGGIAGYVVVSGDDTNPAREVAGTVPPPPTRPEKGNEARPPADQPPPVVADEGSGKRNNAPAPDKASAGSDKAVAVGIRQGRLILENAGNEDDMLHIWQGWGRAEISGRAVFEQKFEDSDDKAQVLLKLLYAWQATNEQGRETDKSVRDQLAALIDKTIARPEFETCDTLRVVKAYYLHEQGRQHWSDCLLPVPASCGDPMLDSMAAFLSAEAWRVLCTQPGDTREILKNEQDDLARADLIAQLIIAARSEAAAGEILQAARASVKQPNSRLLLCLFRSSGPGEEWLDEFCHSFIDTENTPALHQRYAAILQPLLLKFCKAQLARMSPRKETKGKRQAEEKLRVDFIERVYRQLSPACRADYLATFVESTRVGELAGRVEELLGESVDDLPAPLLRQLSHELAEWGNPASLALFVRLFAPDALRAAGSPQVRTSALTIMAIYALHHREEDTLLRELVDSLPSDEMTPGHCLRQLIGARVAREEEVRKALLDKLRGFGDDAEAQKKMSELWESEGTAGLRPLAVVLHRLITHQVKE